MTRITEDYVSFEVAKLLKEKGFNEALTKYWDNEGGSNTIPSICEFNDCSWRNSELSKREYSCPTLQMAMKWLREAHNIHITIYYSAFLYGTHPYYWSIDKMDSIPRANTQIKTSTSTHDYSFAHYEKACESAIRYCLEHLI